MPENDIKNNFREVNRIIVSPAFCDELGHMNIQYYYQVLSDGMFNVMELIGLPKEEISIRRTSLALFKEEAHFCAELNEGDEFFMATALEKIGNKSIVFQHRFFSKKEALVIFKSKFVSVLMDLDTRISIAIPDGIKQQAKVEFPKFFST